jgi:subfamily B ATP-binding cassette protein MsbA
VAAACSLGALAASVAIPFGVRILADEVIRHRDTAIATRVTLLLVLITAASAVFGYAQTMLLARVSGKVVADLRVHVFSHLQELDIAFYDSRRVGDLLSRLTADATLVQVAATSSMVDLFQDVVRFAIVAVLVLLLDWRLALFVLVAAPVVVLIGLVFGRFTRRPSREAQAALGRSTVIAEEALPAMRIVKAFSRTEYEIGRYREAVDDGYRAGLALAHFRALLSSLLLLLTFVPLAGVLWLGGQEVAAGRLSPGGLFSFLLYVGVLIGPFYRFAQVYGQFQQAAGGADRLFEILDTAPDVTDSPDAVPMPRVSGPLVVHDLRFRYGPALPDVLQEVSLDVAPGELVALVGPSGAGKSTLVSLLLGYYRPQAGTIKLAGYPLAAVTLASWRANLALVPQEPVLFGGTVAENIAYGRMSAAAAEIEEAARAANAHDFISALPHGYGTIVGDRGVRLSGGQRQRIAIARAILRDPALLILDEATSSLDNASEAEVQQGLTALMADRATLVIAHRLTTVERADRIIVLDRGSVVDVGTHAELLNRRGLYYRLYTRRTLETAVLGG